MDGDFKRRKTSLGDWDLPQASCRLRDGLTSLRSTVQTTVPVKAFFRPETSPGERDAIAKDSPRQKLFVGEKSLMQGLNGNPCLQISGYMM